MQSSTNSLYQFSFFIRNSEKGLPHSTIFINTTHTKHTTMIKLVLMRHGWSQWNEENRFTGWTDVDLHNTGIQEAKQAGELLAGYSFDYVFTSVLTRAIKTTWLALEYAKIPYTPIEYAWQLNERHYGSLQGLNKAEMAKKYGSEQVQLWRRGYDIQPPKLTTEQAQLLHDKRYPFKKMPKTESLKDTVARVVPYYIKKIVPLLKKEKTILISAHGNSLRALIKHLDGVSDEQIVKLVLPTAIPLVYELDDSLKPIKHYYLGSPQLVEQRIAQAEYRMNTINQ
jgi:2,3-bisphosphoglycerate-dependent phosphoglycerate mutase